MLHTAIATARPRLIAPVLAAGTTDNFGYRNPTGHLPIGRLVHFQRDREIYGDGESADHIFRVEEGVVRTYKFLRDGRRQVDAFHHPGDHFGMEMGAMHSLSASGITDCTLVSFRRLIIERMTVGDTALFVQVFSSALRSLERSQQHTLSLGRRNAVERVASFLIEWADHSPPCAEIILTMSRRDIADYLGLTIETVSRTLSQLRNQCYIDLTSPRHVTLHDTDSLRSLCV